jgi:hypothetical protein
MKTSSCKRVCHVVLHSPDLVNPARAWQSRGDYFSIRLNHCWPGDLVIQRHQSSIKYIGEKTGCQWGTCSPCLTGGFVCVPPMPRDESEGGLQQLGVPEIQSKTFLGHDCHYELSRCTAKWIKFLQARKTTEEINTLIAVTCTVPNRSFVVSGFQHLWLQLKTKCTIKE